MALVTTTQSSLVGGVSQLVPSKRLDTQCEVQDNAYSSLISGLHKRHPTEHVIQTSGASNTGILTRDVHFIDRDASERYVVEVTDESDKDPVIFDLTTGRRVQVWDSSGTLNNASTGTSVSTAIRDYCKRNAAGDNIQMMTLADYTMILNRDTTAAMKAVSVDAVTNVVSNMPDAVNVTHDATNTDIRAGRLSQEVRVHQVGQLQQDVRAPPEHDRQGREDLPPEWCQRGHLQQGDRANLEG